MATKEDLRAEVDRLKKSALQCVKDERWAEAAWHVVKAAEASEALRQAAVAG